MLRIALFLLTNLAIVIVASITLSLLGFEGYLAANGVDLNLSSLLVFCFVFGMAGSIVSLLLSKTMAKMGTGTQIIATPRNADEQWLVETVAELAKDAGIGMPEVGIFQSQTSNAFATGWDRNNALVAVSTGLLSRFSRDEARAVMAHEIGHVANGDMVTLALIQGVVNTFVMFFSRIIGHTIDRAVFKTERGHGPAFYITTFVAEIILGVLASMIVFWFSRQREFRADAAGAQLAGAPAMIGALERLRAEQGAPSELPDTMVAFGIRTGGNTMMRLFMTHPPLEERIAALKAR
ncbi:MAG: protease HtpX [Gammaproteobacteria bacterium]|jgi:heat shock protein HtpX|nr:protease HtpX [Gammaproteobacteria bacterium]NCW09216.1 protease HtpX [Gammaproteobacteria bacterium]NCX48981.1 protease HtpX [Gammaproteobacteria bacterium]